LLVGIIGEIDGLYGIPATPDPEARHHRHQRETKSSAELHGLSPFRSFAAPRGTCVCHPFTGPERTHELRNSPTDRCVPGRLAGTVYAVAMAEVQGESRPFRRDSPSNSGGMPWAHHTRGAPQNNAPPRASSGPADDGRTQSHRSGRPSPATLPFRFRKPAASRQSPGENMIGYTTVTMPPSGCGNDSP
jgi:hypothetical protein